MRPTVGVARERYTCLTEGGEKEDAAAHPFVPSVSCWGAHLRPSCHPQTFRPAFSLSFSSLAFSSNSTSSPPLKRDLPLLARSNLQLPKPLFSRWAKRKGLSFNGVVLLSYCIARGR